MNNFDLISDFKFSKFNFVLICNKINLYFIWIILYS